MKKATLLFASLSVLLSACQNSAEKSSNNTDQANAGETQALDAGDPPPPAASFISLDTANVMLMSYLNSINYTQEDTNLRSIIIDANALRQYLNGPGGNNITNFKLMFAHTTEYINNGGLNQPAGYKSGALTLIIAGYDSNGNYIYTNGMVMDRSIPCPYNCPPSGSAAVDTFTITR